MSNGTGYLESDAFIGRGEERTVEILKKLFPKASILQQVPINKIITKKQHSKLNEHYSKHKFDIVVRMLNRKLIIEVNYNHGKIAEDKWRNVYLPLIEERGWTGVTIDDNECEYLFQLKDGVHTDTWQDYIDVINALQMAGVQPQ